jgi:hypothetical protein
LIRQWQGLQVLHQVAGMCEAAVCMCCLEPWGADRGSRGQKAIGACCTPSWPTTEVAAPVSAEYTANLSSWGWRPKGPAKVRRAWKACTVEFGAPCKKLSSAHSKGLARSIAATCSSGSCEVSAKSSGLRGSPCRTPLRE